MDGLQGAVQDFAVMTSRLCRLGFACTIALGLTACGDDDAPLEHGFVKIQLVRSDDQPDSPFVGTGQIFVAMEYDMCLRNFYDTQPDYQQGGPEGALVFGTIGDGGEGWRDRLCDASAADQIDCDVVNIEQELDNSSQLRVTYAITAPEIETKFLKFGPVPLSDLASCEGGGRPIMNLVPPNPVRGFDAQGSPIWETSSFDTPQAAPGQGASLVVKIARN